MPIQTVGPCDGHGNGGSHEERVTHEQRNGEAGCPPEFHRFVHVSNDHYVFALIKMDASTEFMRDMRAIRRARTAHWKSCREDRGSVKQLKHIFEDALQRYSSEPASSSAECRQQNWEFAVCAAIDTAAEVEAGLRDFVATLPLPDTNKSRSRLVRRVLLEWHKREEKRLQ